MSKSATVWIDGASRGNPGPAGIGIHIETEDGETLADISEYLGSNYTNNQAEYSALVKALKKCENFDIEEIEFRSDSQLLIRQMKGQYDVNSENLINLYRKANKMTSNYKKIVFKHISRKDNSIADGLANEAIDREN